jgi:hypothetical protein
MRAIMALSELGGVTMIWVAASPLVVRSVGKVDPTGKVVINFRRARNCRSAGHGSLLGSAHSRCTLCEWCCGQAGIMRRVSGTREKDIEMGEAEC